MSLMACKLAISNGSLLSPSNSRMLISPSDLIAPIVPSTLPPPPVDSLMPVPLLLAAAVTGVGVRMVELRVGMMGTWGRGGEFVESSSACLCSACLCSACLAASIILAFRLAASAWAATERARCFPCSNTLCSVE